MDAIIDMQGFTGHNNEFVPKEITILLVEKMILIKEENYLVQPPYDIKALSQKEQKSVNWLKNNFHNLDWNDGPYCYTTFCQHLSSLSIKRLFVKGKMKASFLKNKIQSHIKVCNLDEKTLSLKKLNSLEKYKYYCKRHLHSFKRNCSRQNAYVLLDYLNNEYVTAYTNFKAS